MEAYMKTDSGRLEELFRKWRVDDEASPQFMVERLARANMNRRKQFKYWERRKIKYDYYHRAATEPSTATSPNTAVILETGSTVSTDTFVVTFGGTFDPSKLPPPPEVDADSPEFECPYCFTMCAEETARPHAWRRHILRDLRPYICTFKNCKNADQQYDTFTDGYPMSHPTMAFNLQQHEPVRFDAAGHSNSANIGSIDWDSSSENSDFDDEWAAHTKTVHLDLTACGFGVTRIQLRPEDVVETVSAAHLRTVYKLPPATVFQFSDPNGHPIPLDYDSLYDDIIVHIDFVRDATSSG
ncbi:uncharacterized protein BDW70DRAFT_163356 [Aspergillus foveolatus]|uniref:uncharacterized protein n=1 Tax=Aspergillus foveolatus TaxID=210207 RepID=UPI003CCDF453